MLFSLDTMAFSLDDDQCKHFSFKAHEAKRFISMLGNIVYEKFEETKLLPKNAFYSKLKMKISASRSIIMHSRVGMNNIRVLKCCLRRLT